MAYVERNPVRARLVATPREHAWSSAAVHLSGEDRRRFADVRFWSESGGVERWREYLSDGDDAAETKPMRRATYSGHHFGDEEFMEALRAQRKNLRSGSRRAETRQPVELRTFAAE